MKRVFAIAYAVIILWCTFVILWRRLGMGAVPTQLSASVVWVTIALNLLIAGILIRRWLVPSKG